MRYKLTAPLVILLAGLAAAAPRAAAQAVSEPAGLNLGFTSFMDGFGKTTPGFLFEQYDQVQDFSSINGNQGRNIPVFRNPNISADISLNQVIYLTPWHLFGGTLAMNALLPIIDLNASFATNSPVTLRANQGLGVGDLTWGPYLQMPPIIIGGRPIFDQRFEFDVISPIGAFNRAKDINQSAGYWSLNPYWTMTLLPTADTEISTRLYYLHNFQTTQIGSSVPVPFGTVIQAGDAGWVNFTGSYKITPKFNVGMNGFFFKQFTDNTVNGALIHANETENLSIGPGAMYALDPADILFFNSYAPVIANNTAGGFRIQFRIVHVF